ncbi:MAG: hypothetical protein ABIT83_00935 [Massilia sp.]
MKRLSVLLLLLCLAVLSGCAAFRKPAPKPEPVAVKAGPAQLVDANGAPIEALPFRLGVSSATVEQLGKLQGCRSSEGAGLVTPAGAVEVYRLRCDSGKTVFAKCELRQCRTM